MTNSYIPKDLYNEIIKYCKPLHLHLTRMMIIEFM